MEKRIGLWLLAMPTLVGTIAVTACWLIQRRTTRGLVVRGAGSAQGVQSSKGFHGEPSDDWEDGAGRSAMKGAPSGLASLPAHLRDWGDEGPGSLLEAHEARLSDKPPPPWRFHPR